MIAFTRNTDLKSPKRRSYHETPKQIQLPTPTGNFRLFSTVSQVLIKTLLESLILKERDRGIYGRRISGKIIIKDSGHLLPLRKR
jgi:hypothetical protein